MNETKLCVDKTINSLCEYIDRLTKEENTDIALLIAENTKALAVLVIARTLAETKYELDRT